MEHTYIVELHYSSKVHFAMPYLFTSEKDAYMYGEFKFRKDNMLQHYKVIRIYKLTRFYQL